MLNSTLKMFHNSITFEGSFSFYFIFLFFYFKCWNGKGHVWFKSNIGSLHHSAWIKEVKLYVAWITDIGQMEDGHDHSKCLLKMHKSYELLFLNDSEQHLTTQLSVIFMMFEMNRVFACERQKFNISEHLKDKTRAPSTLSTFDSLENHPKNSINMAQR